MRKNKYELSEDDVIAYAKDWLEIKQLQIFAIDMEEHDLYSSALVMAKNRYKRALIEYWNDKIETSVDMISIKEKMEREIEELLQIRRDI
jgi:hypothetical protein